MMIFAQMASNYRFVELEADSSATVMVRESMPLLDNSSLEF